MAFPGQLKVDYVRVYQDASTAMSADNSTMVCSPPNMPTEEYIKAHAGDYAGAPNTALSAGRARLALPETRLDFCGLSLVLTMLLTTHGWMAMSV